MKKQKKKTSCSLSKINWPLIYYTRIKLFKIVVSPVFNPFICELHFIVKVGIHSIAVLINIVEGSTDEVLTDAG